MWQTKYASAIPKSLGLGLNFRHCSEGYFFSGRPQSVAQQIQLSQSKYRAAWSPVNMCATGQTGSAVACQLHHNSQARNIVFKTYVFNMDEALLRFPHLGQQIFESLDPDSLERSLVVSKSWKKFISNQKFPWIRLICNKKTQKDLLKLLKKMTVMKLRKMAIPFKRRSSRLCSRKSSCLKYAQYSSNVLVNNFKKYNYLQPQVRLFCNQLH